MRSALTRFSFLLFSRRLFFAVHWYTEEHREGFVFGSLPFFRVTLAPPYTGEGD